MRILLLFCLVAAVTLAMAAPPRLADTGLDEAKAIAFSPRYPLWSDGAAKRRWLYLPPGTSIDTSRPDAWDFPPGTRAWKEFSVGARRVETRYIERLADGSWRYAAYVWNPQGTEALLAPEQGTAISVAGAPGGRYAIPSRTDCLACHEGAPSPILGYSAVQSGSLAASSLEQRALGYLHGNCGHCHNDTGPLAGVGLFLAQRAGAPQESAARALRSLLERRDDVLRRVRSANPYVRMPPLGVSVIDAEAVGLIQRFLLHPQEVSP